MIGLFGRNDRSVLGIASILEIEKIPYRRLVRLEPCDGELLLVSGADLSPEEVLALAGRRALVLNGGPAYAQLALGAEGAQCTPAPSTLALVEPLWPNRIAEMAQRYGKRFLRLPPAPVCTVGYPTRGITLAAFSHASAPAVVRHESGVWSAVDLGAAFANLITEAYWPAAESSAFPAMPPWIRRAAETLYYAVPGALRAVVQRRCYAAMQRQLQRREQLASEYPVDPTGWLLIELVKRLILLAAGVLVRVERWPSPYRAAAALTHDIEPRRYAYGRGLQRLIDQVEGEGGPAVFGLVAGPATRYLDSSTAAGLRPYEVLCHGLEHRGEPVHGRAHVAATVRAAQVQLERHLQRPVRGYRSPRLDRSGDLLWALDQSRFVYDSSYPDVDRENMRHFGSGVRVNVPFRPLVSEGAERIRFSRCLEFPLTAPDCIQPLLFGEDVPGLRGAVAAKAGFVRETGGVYVALVHAGVFGDRDAELRAEHLAFVRAQLRHSDVWLAGLGDLSDWWRRREGLRLTMRDHVLRIKNTTHSAMEGVRLVIEELNGKTVAKTVVLLPLLEADTERAVAIPGASRLPGTWPYALVQSAPGTPPAPAAAGAGPSRTLHV